MDDELLKDVAESARFYASLTTMGAPHVAPIHAAPRLATATEPSVTPRTVAAVSPPGMSLEAIRDVLGDCQRCKLAGGRTKIVFGQGNPKARLMFVGEAPGADEDVQGLAFVGRAGQLLTDIIEKGMKMRREDVFIANILKCRPPGNRNPEPDEILECHPFLEAQIEVIRPKILVGLGKFSCQWL